MSFDCKERKHDYAACIAGFVDSVQWAADAGNLPHRPAAVLCADVVLLEVPRLLPQNGKGCV